MRIRGWIEIAAVLLLVSSPLLFAQDESDDVHKSSDAPQQRMCTDLSGQNAEPCPSIGDQRYEEDDAPATQSHPSDQSVKGAEVRKSESAPSTQSDVESRGETTLDGKPLPSAAQTMPTAARADSEPSVPGENARSAESGSAASSKTSPTIDALTDLQEPEPSARTVDDPGRKLLHNSFLQPKTDTRLVELPRNLAADQYAIWTSPLRVRLNDLYWLVPMGGIAAGLMSEDTSIMRHVSTSQNRVNLSSNISNAGIAGMLGAGAGMFALGHLTSNDHERETGYLAGEAVLDSTGVTYLVKTLAARERPFEGTGQGNFGNGSGSFPSEHAAAAWSAASVYAHEYPGAMSQFLAYGLASAISATRVTARQHFPSDVFVGSAMGWLVGRQVYNSHHNMDLGGASIGTFDRDPSTRAHESVRNPANMGSPYVPIDYWVYPVFDRLAALGDIQTAFLGIRPWTRMECARLVEELESNIGRDTADNSYESQAYKELSSEFAPELRGRNGERNLTARVESLYTRVTNISGKPLTDGFHFGETLINDYGRPYQQGWNDVSGASAYADAGPFSIYIRGEYQHAPSADGLSFPVRNAIAYYDWNPIQPSVPLATANQAALLDAYASITLGNWDFSFGRQTDWWGPTESGPFLASNNAAPVTMLRIRRTQPFKLPSFLGFLGPIDTEFFVAQLSGQKFVSAQPTGYPTEILYGPNLPVQPFVHGNKISFKPTPNFEFGVGITAIFGGPAYPFTLGNFYRSYAFSNSPINTAPGSTLDPGDRRSSFDFSYRIPKLRNWLMLYLDSFTEDELSPLGYPRRSAMNPGIYMPQLPFARKLDLRIEGMYTDLPNLNDFPGFYYFNGRYHSGYTNDGNIIGNWIGRMGVGQQAWSTYHFSPRNTVQVGFRHNQVDNQFMEGGRQTDFWGQGRWQLTSSLSLSGNLQYESWRFPLLAATPQTDITSSIQLTFEPKAWRIGAK